MALTSKLAKERVTKILRYLCQTVGYDNDEFYEIKQFMTIQLLSDMAGISEKPQVISLMNFERIKFYSKVIKLVNQQRFIMTLKNLIFHNLER